jgi:molybdopterin/thiamine biosynthesis adenylyltransferase
VGVIPERYQKNIGEIGEEGQKKLLNSHVTIVGAGGLGGVLFENLLRAGVGNIKIIDYDVFDQTNLNRQLLSSAKNIGTKKTEIAKKRAIDINPDINIIAIDEKLTAENAQRLLDKTDVICDCVDSISLRFEIQKAARILQMPMVHAAVAGHMGQLMTIFPGDSGIEGIYGEEELASKTGEESSLDNPAPIVFVTASMQAHETISLITETQPPLRGRVLRIDLREWKLTTFSLPKK